MLLLAALAVSAFAGVPEDLGQAADADLPQELRRAAWSRLAQPGNTASLVHLVKDPATSKEQRWVAIRALGPIPDADALDALLAFLEAPEASTRMAALGALGDRKDPAVVDRVATHLADKALLVRATAAESLAALGDPRALPALERALEDPTNHYRGTSMWVRRHYVVAMGAIGTDAAVGGLARALEDDDAAVADAAVDGLEKVAGFSYAEGRTAAEEREAWRRWATRGR